jgi:hypothetical protein
MFKRRFRLPSPALVISMVALSLVLGGSAFAAATATHGDKKADTKLVKKLAPSLSVKHAKTANTAASATSATNATNATNATHATNATSATNATNATNLGGVPASGYFKAANARVDGYANSTAIDNFTSATFTSIASKAFTAPTAGFALISATLSTEADNSLGGVGHLAYELSLDGTALETNTRAHEISTDTANDAESGSGAITEVVPVKAGAHTVSLLALEETPGTGDFIESRQISILFVPNGSASATPFTRKGSGSSSANN